MQWFWQLDLPSQVIGYLFPGNIVPEFWRVDPGDVKMAVEYDEPCGGPMDRTKRDHPGQIWEAGSLLCHAITGAMVEGSPMHCILFSIVVGGQMLVRPSYHFAG